MEIWFYEDTAAPENEKDFCDQILAYSQQPSFIQDLRQLENDYGKELLSIGIAAFGVQIFYVLEDMLSTDALDELTLAVYPPAADSSTHPLYACVDQGVCAEGMFELIDAFYYRRFSLLYKLETYCETNNLLVGYVEKEGLAAVANLLKKYKVTQEEFDYAELDNVT